MEKSHLTGGSSPIAPHNKFARHARAVGVLWGVFSVCFCIIVTVVFIQPHWIGASRDAPPGHMGLWRWCYSSSEGAGGEVTCTGDLLDLNTFTTGILSDNIVLLSTSILTALSVVVTALSVLLMLLFICIKSSRVYHVIGWTQIIAGLLLGASVCVYPLGFGSGEVQRMCGPTARQYNLGECSIRWAYVLAIIGVFDAAVLATLAFVLATRNVKPQHENLYASHELYKDYGDGASLAASRKSLNLQPVMMMPQHTDDTYRQPHHYHL